MMAVDRYIDWNVSAECTRCEGVVAVSDTVRLWDGNTYCRGCVQSIHPPFFQLAKVHRTLAETAELSISSVWQWIKWRYLFQQCLAYAVIGCLSAACSFFVGVDALWFGGAVILALILAHTLLFVLDCLTGFVGRCERFPRTVQVADGTVQINLPSGRIRCPLEDCGWFPSRLRRHSDVFFVPDRPVVLLAFNGKNGREWLPMGLTPGARERWVGFLTLAGVPRQPPPTTMSEFLRTFGVAFLLTIAISGLAFISPAAGFGLLLAIALIRFYVDSHRDPKHRPWVIFGLSVLGLIYGFGWFPWRIVASLTAGAPFFAAATLIEYDALRQHVATGDDNRDA